MDDGTWVDPAGTIDITFCRLLERYKESVTQTKRSRRSEEYRIGKIMRHTVAGYAMRNLTTSVLADYRDQRLKETSNACVCRELATISAVITHAQREWGLAITNPAKLVKKPRLPPGRNRMLKPAELERLLYELNAERHELRSKWLVPLVRLALETAMRQGELLSLQWKHFDFEERTAYLPMTKNGKDRYHRLPMWIQSAPGVFTQPEQLAGSVTVDHVQPLFAVGTLAGAIKPGAVKDGDIVRFIKNVQSSIRQD